MSASLNIFFVRKIVFNFLKRGGTVIEKSTKAKSHSFNFLTIFPICPRLIFKWLEEEQKNFYYL